MQYYVLFGVQMQQFVCARLSLSGLHCTVYFVLPSILVVFFCQIKCACIDVVTNHVVDSMRTVCDHCQLQKKYDEIMSPINLIQCRFASGSSLRSR